MKKNTGFYPRVQVDTAPSSAVGQAGAVLLTDTIRVSGLDVALAAALRPWRKPTAVHHPAKIMLDLAASLAVGGTASPMSLSSGASRACSVKSLPTRRCRGWAMPSPVMSMLLWPRSTPLGLP